MTAPGRDTAPAAATVTGLFAAAELRVGERIAERFRVEELLGVGGMGVVYRAFDESLQVPVALKLLRPELASRADAFARFRQEILLARQVSSPHVVRIHDVVAHEGRWLISMDFVPGRSLERLLDEQAPLPVETMLKILRQLALGLGAAHQRQVVHRDLKPANVLVTDALEAYITDFGIARSAGVTGVTGSGVVVGTPEYLAPEQARAETVDQRSDLYALGLIGFEMLTGKLPFPGSTPAEMLAQRIVRSPPSVASVRPGLPAWVVSLIGKLTMLKPAHRFQRAEDVVRAIDERRVPGLWRARARRLVLPGAIAAALIGTALLLPRWPFAPVVAPASALDLAVLPLQSAEGDAPLAAAVNVLLVETLLARGTATADPERLTRTLRQLDFDPGAAARHGAKVAQTLGARRLLQGRIERQGSRLSVAFELGMPDGAQPPQRASSGAVTPDALAVAIADALRRLELPIDPATTPGWPGDAEAQIAYGEARLAQARGEPAAALAAYTRATARAPGFALAWRDELLLRERLRDPEYGARAQRASSAVQGTRGRDVEAVRALTELAEGRAEEAARRLQALVSASPHDHPLALLAARALESAGRDADASALRQRVADADPQNPDAWFALGRAAIVAGDAQRAVDDYLVRAQVLYNRLGDAWGQAETANAFGNGYERLGRIDNAIEQFERAARQREALGDAIGGARSLRNLAAAQAVRGEFAAARTALDQAQQLLAALPAPAERADLANDRGLLAEEQGDFASALAAYREALELRRTLGDAGALGESLLNVGFAYHQSGEFDNAATYFREADATYAAADDPTGRVRAGQNLGLLEIARGDWAAARERLAQTLSAAEAGQMVEELAVSALYLAELDHLEGRLADALAHAEAAERGFVEREDQRGQVESALRRAAVWLDAGRPQQTAVIIEPLLATPPENREQLAAVRVLAAELALAQGDAATAATAARSGLEDAQAAHSVPVALRARLTEVRAAGAAGKGERARRALAEAERELEQHPSLALALYAAEARLAAGGTAAAYADATALLKRAPSYVRAAAIHRTAASALRRSGAAREAGEADAAAAVAQDRLDAQRPAEPSPPPAPAPAAGEADPETRS